MLMTMPVSIWDALMAVLQAGGRGGQATGQLAAAALHERTAP